MSQQDTSLSISPSYAALPANKNINIMPAAGGVK